MKDTMDHIAENIERALHFARMKAEVREILAELPARDRKIVLADLVVNELCGATILRQEAELGDGTRDQHVDDYILEHNSDPYACWMFCHFRLPAVLKMRFEPFMKNHQLFCTYEGERYRVTGASRLGDVWLTKDFNKDIGYDKRVDVSKCSKWSPSP